MPEQSLDPRIVICDSDAIVAERVHRATGTCPDALPLSEFVASGQYLERKMPHAHLAVVAGGEHSMHEDSHAGDVAALIETFVAQLG